MKMGPLCVLLGGGVLGALALSALSLPAAGASASWALGGEAAGPTLERHVCLEFPVPRVGVDCTARSPQKIGPCGVAGRSEHVNVFQPGETITVVFNETVNHPSHYRIAFNPDGDDFPDPESVDDIESGAPYTLADGIPDEEAAVQELAITFPDIECENCTLQLIQVMHDKGANGFGGRTAEGGNDDIYYACADIALRRN